MTTPAVGTIPCIYRNESPSIQIACVALTPESYLERTLLPGQCLMFDAVPTASLRIYSNTVISAIAEDTIPCKTLQTVTNQAQGAASLPAMAKSAWRKR